jgi:hypothetical protein
MNGKDIIKGDLALHKGLIKVVSSVPRELMKKRELADMVDAEGAWVTPEYGFFYYSVSLRCVSSMYPTTSHQPHGCRERYGAAGKG